MDLFLSFCFHCGLSVCVLICVLPVFLACLAGVFPGNACWCWRLDARGRWSASVLGVILWIGFEETEWKRSDDILAGHLPGVACCWEGHLPELGARTQEQGMGRWHQERMVCRIHRRHGPRTVWREGCSWCSVAGLGATLRGDRETGKVLQAAYLVFWQGDMLNKWQ